MKMVIFERDLRKLGFGWYVLDWYTEVFNICQEFRDEINGKTRILAV